MATRAKRRSGTGSGRDGEQEARHDERAEGCTETEHPSRYASAVVVRRAGTFARASPPLAAARRCLCEGGSGVDVRLTAARHGPNIARLPHPEQGRSGCRGRSRPKRQVRHRTAPNAPRSVLRSRSEPGVRAQPPPVASNALCAARARRARARPHVGMPPSCRSPASSRSGAARPRRRSCRWAASSKDRA
jgi:hypothetical protein